MISWKLFYGVNYVFHHNNSINDHVANISLHLIPMKLQKPLWGIQMKDIIANTTSMEDSFSL